MNELISTIMPVFNTSVFLSEAIGSMLLQSHKNWELICVNDGSTDDSLDILEKYSSMDSRIKVFSQNNMGAAKARKLGISESKGKYVSFLDSDDAYSQDYLSETLRVALSSKADVVMPILISFWGDKNEFNFNELNNLKEGQLLKGKEAFLRTFPWSVHGLNLYKASHLKKYALTEISDFDSYNADEYLTRYLLLYASTIVISKGTYNYRHNLESISRTFDIDMHKKIFVNNELFNLALKVECDSYQLSYLASYFLHEKVILILEIIKNKRSISFQEHKDVRKAINKKSSWNNYIDLQNSKVLKYYLFCKIPISLSSFLFDLKKKFDKNKTMIKLK